MSEHIFISYAVENRETADSICHSLESSGWRCWLAPRDIVPGGDWGEAIIDAINQSRLMVLVYSDAAVRSVQIKREVERASSKGITIVPFRVDESPVSKSFEYFISDCYWIDALTVPLDQHLEFLKEMVVRFLGDPANPVEPARRIEILSAASSPIGPSRSAVRRRRLWQGSGKRWIAAIAGIVFVSLIVGLGVTWWWPSANDFEGHFNKAMTFRQNGQFDKAIEEFDLAVAAAPANFLGYRGRGEMYYMRAIYRMVSNDYTPAIADFERAIKLNPKDDISWQLLGQSYIPARDWEKAESALTTALKLNSGNVSAWKARAHIYQQTQRYDRAISDLTEARSVTPDDVQVLGVLGDVYISKGDYKNAVEQFSRAITLFPNDRNLRLRRSEAYAGLGELSLAQADKVEAQKRQ